ncbi:hypothetical protein IC582_018416 [Cucumis melo]
MEMTMVGSNGGDTTETHNKINKYALACAIVGSIISIIFGYGKFFLFYRSEEEEHKCSMNCT